MHVSGAAGGLTGLTLELYSYIIEQLPPTPSRFHYIFNLRDLSRVTEGLLMANPTCFTTAAQFVRLWRNEVLRVFHDRLISTEDKQASCTCAFLAAVSHHYKKRFVASTVAYGPSVGMLQLLTTLSPYFASVMCVAVYLGGSFIP